MQVIAHRGFAADGLENARSTLVAAAATADSVEFDVRLARDGEPVVFHDRRVDRLTDHEGRVDAYAADDLAAMPLVGTAETIPRLSTVLDGLDGPIDPELKSAAVPERVVSLLDRYDGRVRVSSFRPAVLAAVPSRFDRAVLCGPAAAADDLPDGAPVGFAAGLESARDLGAAAIHSHHSLCTAEAVESARAAGLTVNAWTVRSREVGTALQAAGVDGAIADSPTVVPVE